MEILHYGNPSFNVLTDKINKVVHSGEYDEKFKFVLRINLNNTTMEKVRETLNCIEIKNRHKTYLLIRAIYNTHAYSEKNNNSVFLLKEYFDLSTELGVPYIKREVSIPNL